MILSFILNLFVFQQLGVGVVAPDFKGKNQYGDSVSLSQFKGKRVVLYFYPKDDTPGCTAQACNLRDNFGLLTKNDVVVIGVSVDNTKSHEVFAKKYELPFILIADEDKKISSAYGVLNPILRFSNRTTFLINKAGVIEHIIKSPNTKNHTEEIKTYWNF